MAAKLGRTPTQGDIVAEAVQRDFDYLRRWCTDQWSYVGVVVKFISEDLEESESETARELADEICSRLDDEMAEALAESRPDMHPPA